MPDGVKNFLSQIVTMLPALQAVEQRLDRETGRRFNAFSLFNTDENASTRVLDFLLNPNEAHGQKDVFLRLFIQRFVPEWNDIFSYRIAKPASATERVDVIVADGNHWLGIENKIFDALEQPAQATRYLDALRIQGGDYRLVYLSPKGQGPSCYSYTPEGREIHGQKLICGAWTQADTELQDNRQRAAPSANIVDWLLECERECDAENMRWFLKQLRIYVYSVINGEKEPDMADAAVVSLALHSRESLEAALRISENCWEIKKSVLIDLLQCIRECLRNYAQRRNEHLEVGDWEVVDEWRGGNWVGAPERKWLPILLRRRQWPEMVGVAIQAENGRRNEGPWEVFIGVMAPTGQTWNNDARNQGYYGPTNNFIGDQSRQRTAAAIGLTTPQTAWWVLSEHLRDAGNDISDWRRIEIISRLKFEKDTICQLVVAQMQNIALKIETVLIDNS